MRWLERLYLDEEEPPEEGKEESQGVTSLLIKFITIGMHLSGRRSRLATEVVVHGAFSDSAPQHYCILANFGFVHDHGH